MNQKFKRPDQQRQTLRVGNVVFDSEAEGEARRGQLARIILNEMVQFVGLLDKDGRVLEVNQAALEGAGLKLEEIAGKPIWETRWWAVSEEWREKLRQAIARALQGEFVRYDAEIYGANAGRDKIIIDFSLTPVLDDSNEVVFLVPEGRDLTEEKKVKAALEAANAQLQNANRELEALAYTISHDLKSPLRVIEGFSQAILDEHGSELPEDVIKSLTRIYEKSEQMFVQIEELLKFCRLTRAPLRIETVDLGTLAETIFSELALTDPKREVIFETRRGCFAECDSGLVRILLENLLDNAWKYTKKCDEARIEFGCREEGRRRVFFVRDNGIGFDMAYVDKIFEPFQRLHRDREFPGTGIGLASARRIVDHHGGRIWAESKVKEGTSIYFSF